MFGWDFVYNFVYNGDFLEVFDQSCNLEFVKIMWENLRQ